MTDSTTYIKWFCRVCLVLLVAGMSYIVLLPGFGFSQWVPHNLLRSMNVPYDVVLLFETILDKFVHFFGAFIITVLCICSVSGDTPQQRHKALKIAYFVIPSLIISAEFAQLQTGRSFSGLDIAFGLIGFMLASRQFRATD